MANGKNPYLRYKIINSCLANPRRRYWAIEEIIEKLAEYDLQVERRTVELDFETMRHDNRLGYHAPIAYCRKNKGYHYTDSNYSVDAIPFSEEDLLALRFAVGVLQHYKGTELLNRFERVIDRVVKLVNPFNGSSQEQSPEPIVFFENTSYGKGIEHFDTVLRAVYNQQPLIIVYGNPAVDDIVLPYALKEYRDRWYVLCFSSTKQDIVTLVLDRISSIIEFF